MVHSSSPSESENDFEDEICLLACLGAINNNKKLRKRKVPTFRVNPYLRCRRTKGRYQTSFQDMVSYPPAFKENFHMDSEIFQEIHDLIKPRLDINMKRRPHDFISAKEKLAVVLEYLSCGSLQRHMASTYRISKQHFRKIIDAVCEAICDALKDEIPPYTTENFIETANDFNYLWNCPNVLGALDGKHINIKKPNNAGTLYYNYKGFNSIILLGVADSHYRFSYVDIGGYGSEGDANVFSKSTFGSKLLNENLPIPSNAKIGNIEIPFYFIGDDAFPMHTSLLKPYKPAKGKKLTKEETIFNYRLSRARRCLENAFGILCRRWLCLARMMLCGAERAQKIVACCCYLHNFLLNKNRSTYCPANFADRITPSGEIIEGEWRSQISRNQSMFFNDLNACQGRPNVLAKLYRDQLKKIFNSVEGKLAWQDALF